jgi:hypothetical protein
MTVAELIEELSKMDQEADVAVPDDGFGWEYQIDLRHDIRTAEQCKDGQGPYSIVRIY